ncbi:MAG: hypothetical protein PWP23_2283 [Candidatus Sumerlaeota bacterium]|nr:hypothetical protein [Candidatus Sumerlaeota bacterium]
MLVFRRAKRGVALLSAIMALLIIFILTGMYMNGGPGGGAGGAAGIPFMLTLPDRARSSVCDANRRIALTTLITSQMSFGSHLSTEQMAQAAAQLPRCPGDGKFYIEGQEISCTQHVLTPKFRERLGIL